MSDFVSFCRAHGLLIDRLPPAGVWRRYATEDHPRKRNGAAKYLGDHGFVQNHAQMQQVAVWSAEGGAVRSIDRQALRRAERAEQERIARGRAAAAHTARSIIDCCSVGGHPYLERKGLTGARGLVWRPEDGRTLLVVPMKVYDDIVGCQLIDERGQKRFLTGQRTKGASFVLGRGEPVWVEGYATALSVRAALAHCGLARAVVVTFSAHNLEDMAAQDGRGLVVADNDESGAGEHAAIATGLPYWISDRVGEDYNDYHGRVGLFRAAMSLKQALMRRSRAAESA